MKAKITDIKPNPKNPRIIKDAKFEKLVNSIKEFPEMLEKRPLVCYTDVDKKLVILGGNMRYKAAKELGIKELSVVLADDWTEEQKAQFLIKDNLGYGEWDWDTIANEWDSDNLIQWGLDIPNFETVLKEPEIDIDKLSEAMDSYINNTIKQIVLYYNDDKYIDILNNLNRISENEGLKDNSEAVEFLIDKYIK